MDQEEQRQIAARQGLQCHPPPPHHEAEAEPRLRGDGHQKQGLDQGIAVNQAQGFLRRAMGVLTEEARQMIAKMQDKEKAQYDGQPPVQATDHHAANPTRPRPEITRKAAHCGRVRSVPRRFSP